MTHRQFVSAYDPLDGQNYNDALVADMQALLPNINLFLWGHEHSFVPFVDQLQVPAYQSPPKAKLRTMGGSARHPYDQSPSTAGAKLIRTPPQKPGGNDYDWVDSANGHDNHTYAILDLAASTATYYQVTAWKLGDSNPVKSAPTQPILIDQL